MNSNLLTQRPKCSLLDVPCKTRSIKIFCVRVRRRKIWEWSFVELADGELNMFVIIEPSSSTALPFTIESAKSN